MISFKAEMAQLLIDTHHGLPFVAIDPGARGAAIIMGGGGKGPKEATIFRHDEGRDLPELCSKHGVSAIVCEEAFVSSRANPGQVQSQLKLAFSAGRVVGRIEQAIPGAITVKVYPATWQAYQRGSGSQLKRDQGIEVSLLQEGLQDALDAVHRTNPHASIAKPDREGVAAAWGIAVWWRDVIRDGVPS